ncbi:MAG: hypothetical protein HYW07_04160 [Candidatus Latescibacteria bacterium]|nr:hypothetical protein [Candidatus Latescibacterota bacterium]
MVGLPAFFQHLKQPEYLHVLLNPWPVYGMAAGAFMLLAAILAHGLKEQEVALIWLALMGGATWLAVAYGQQGYDRVLAMSNQEAQQWLKVHMDRAETFAWVFYATGLAALIALLARRRWPVISRYLVGLTWVLALCSTAVGGWISQAGGQVRHSEFREGPPPAEMLRSLQEKPSHDHSPGETTRDSETQDHREGAP